MSCYSFEEEMMYEAGATYGDPRRCPRHPEVQTSSDDGMFDCDCYKCEHEAEEAYQAMEAARVGGHCAWRQEEKPGCLTAAEFEAASAAAQADEEIPF